MTVSIEHAGPPAGRAVRLPRDLAPNPRFSLREIALVAQLDLRGDASDANFAERVCRVLGGPLPVAANTWLATQTGEALWLGPDEWLVVAADGEAGRIERELREALAGVHHAVTDVSASRTVIEIAGADARSVLAKGCTLDMHAQSFAVGHCAQTLLARSQIILQRVESAPVYRLYVRNSFAAYVARWLADAAAESAASREMDAERIATRLA